MKKLLFLIILLFFVTPTFAQEDMEVRSPKTIETPDGVQLVAKPTEQTEESVLDEKITESSTSTIEEVKGAEVEQNENTIAQDTTIVPQPRTIETEQGTENIAVPTDETVTITEDEFTTQTEQIFTIYTHEDCPHCAEVEEFVSLNSIEENINFIQLKDNDEALEELQNIWEKFDVAENEMGWPFMVYTIDGEELYAVGDVPINEVLSEQLGIENPVEKEPENQGSNLFLMILGGVFFVGVVGYGAYSMFTNKK